MNDAQFDIAIIGGGLAGLALSIQSARAGYQTVLFEKEHYPFHRVCGEYISLESWDFLEQLGVRLSAMELPLIKRLQVTAPNGKLFQSELPLGGFGISRYKLDNELAHIAKAAGVVLLEGHKVTQAEWDGGLFHLKAEGKNFTSKLAAGAFGKRSNLDVKWNRAFVQKKPSKINNYIGVKYHIETVFPEDVIALHNFENGYCGISKIEDNRYCMCYLTNATNLSKYGNSIEKMQEAVLFQNPHLEQLFTQATFLYDSPVTISQISFQYKPQIEQHVLLLGDAAGMITPLCGNGMSMALHGSKIAFECLDGFLQQRLTRLQMENQYQQMWQHQFALRLRTGRMIQQLFGKPAVTNLFVETFRTVPLLARPLIRLTHGEPF
ncbi:MAG: NAD(P)/FAD-dependent oxidoreductase [Saprospiraceae bacterium]|nr:NAD(P)/FAD-dependent oxidoreductase [Saprospiraceae bacterium]